ncbi:MAG: hypothetical protein M3Q45_01060, partial [Chloroflexota bacterium]|nr:hypothetical protein [Chloroflexota bacterium]
MNTETIFRLLTALLVSTAVAISVYFRHKAERKGGALDKAEGQKLLIWLRLLGLLAIFPLLGYIINPDWVVWARFGLPTPV